MTLAPLVADGKVMVGASGGELGVRGFVAAYDADTGQQVWRTYTVPAPGRTGQRDLAHGRPVEERRRARVGHRQLRPGNEPRVLGHRQRRPVDGRPAARRQPLHRIHGRPRRRDRPDQGPHPVPPERLVGLGRGVAADSRRLPAQRPHRQGAHRRRPQRLPVVPRAHGRADQVRRRHALRAAERVPEPRPRHRASRRRPGPQARHRQDRRLLPVALGRQELAADRVQSEDPADLHPGQREPVRHARRARRRSTPPAAATPGATSTLYLAPGADHIGEVQAWNVDTGQRVWTHHFPTSANWGPMLATGGGLVFTGGTNDRMFHAFDAATGKLLWEYPTNSGITGQPSSFMVDGRSTSRWPRAGASMRGPCRRASTGCSPASSRRCPRAAPSGCSR